jgi:MFS family permease
MVVLFVFVEAKVPAPLVRLTLLRDPALTVGLFSSALVSTVMMTTLVVGPFYLSLALGLKSASVGLVLSLGPLVTAVTGVSAGRMADRMGATRVTILGLVGIASGATILALLPAPCGVIAYIVPIVTMTVSYALFQTANNTAVMRALPSNRRGVVSGILNLSRNLGLITGASVMGAVFVFASKATDLTKATPAAVAAGMRVTFAFAAVLIVFALAVAIWSRADKTPLSARAKATA